MNRYLIFFFTLFCLISISNASEDVNIEAVKTEIRQKSSVWNTVFTTRDVTPLLPLLAEDVQMASAGGKWRTPVGTENFIQSLFRRRPDITWVNEPKEIIINPSWMVAYENGDWTEGWTEPDGKTVITGKYVALWKQQNNTWFLQAMIFTPLKCSGTSQYCKPQKERIADKQKKHDVVFTQANSNNMIQFEKEIAYFYGAKNPKAIAEHYIQAIQALEGIGLQENGGLLRQTMFVPLKKAYEEVQTQTGLKFDLDKATQYEIQLILAQSREAPFETLYQIMTNLYQEVFQSNAMAVHKGAMLRTFLYKYKISLLKNEKTENGLSKEDQIFMRSIAKESEQELNKLRNLSKI